MYKKLLCQVNYSSKPLDKVPFVIGPEGTPFEPLNAFIRAALFDSSKNGVSTVNAKVDKIVTFLCYLQKNDRRWTRATHDRVRQFRNQGGIGKRKRNSTTINGYIGAIYEFYWWCEGEGYCNRVIGINNVDKDDYLFPLFVYPPGPNDTKDYSLPNLLDPTPSRMRTDITDKEKWEAAYEKALDEDSIYSQRDAALILFILQSGARRGEAQSAHTDQFNEDPHPTQKTMPVKVRKTKNSDGGRILNIPVETYLEMQNFIEDVRPSLLTNRRIDAGYLFCNPKGQSLSNSYFNRILTKYAIKPHDGRSTNLTEFFIEKIKEGIDEESAILLAREHAGHSQNDRSAKTLKQHYLQAKAIFNAQNQGTYLEQEKRKSSALQAELDLAKSKIAQLEHELEVLKTDKRSTLG